MSSLRGNRTALGGHSDIHSCLHYLHHVLMLLPGTRFVKEMWSRPAGPAGPCRGREVHRGRGNMFDE